jgi:hypothetical protein
MFGVCVCVLLRCLLMNHFRRLLSLLGVGLVEVGFRVCGVGDDAPLISARMWSQLCCEAAQLS